MIHRTQPQSHADDREPAAQCAPGRAVRLSDAVQRWRVAVLVVYCSASWLFAGVAAAQSCGDEGGVFVQVLGSGGPIADDARASSGYLVWLDGRSILLVDAGGGSFTRFGEAGAAFDELEHIAISHFHADHSADLIALLKSGYFSGRSRTLSISGPGARGAFPGLSSYLQSMLGEGGAYAYLSGYLDGSAGLVELEPSTLDPDRRVSMPVLDRDTPELVVVATGVPHGIVPTLAYRVQVAGKTIVFASDQNGKDDSFIDFTRDADLLVMHMAVRQGATGAALQLHAPPERIGEIARDSSARHLVLSHFMPRSLAELQQNVQIVRRQFGQQITVATDLACIGVGDEDRVQD